MDCEQRVNGLLGAVWTLNGQELEQALLVQCGGDEALRREVEKRLVLRKGSAQTDRAAEQSLVQLAAEASDRPSIIGEYRVLEEIGEGGFGVVYLVRHRTAGYFAAVKCPRRGSPAARNAWWFEREAKFAGKLDHPNIVRIRHVDVLPDGRPYIVSELVRGPSLRQYLKEGNRFGAQGARSLIVKVCRALGHLHEHGIAHGDLTPANVLIDHNGEPKLTDFGLACGLEPEDRTLGGTREYMSPALLNGSQRMPNVQSDLWAVGVIFYELLTGRRPFTVSCRDDVWVSEPDCPVAPRRVDGSIPASINRMCMRFFQ